MRWANIRNETWIHDAAPRAVFDGEMVLIQWQEGGSVVHILALSRESWDEAVGVVERAIASPTGGDDEKAGERKG